MSGWMSSVCEPQYEPVRQKPQITSSATSSTSYLRSTAWIFGKYPLGGTITPPAPMIGSAHIAATVSGPSFRIICSSSSASLVA